MTFGDAIILALVSRLPLRGDGPLLPLLRLRPMEPADAIAPPPAFAAFFAALGSE